MIVALAHAQLSDVLVGSCVCPECRAIFLGRCMEGRYLSIGGCSLGAALSWRRIEARFRIWHHQFVSDAG